MTRLPIPGSDEGNWGSILNDFLSQAHGADGALKDGSVAKTKLSSSVQASLDNADAAAAGTIADNSITTVKVQNGAITSAKITDGTIVAGDLSASAAIAKTQLATDVQTSLTAADNSIPSSQKGASSGVATLTGTTLTSSQLPTSVVTKSGSSGDTGKAIDAYTGLPLSLLNNVIDVRNYVTTVTDATHVVFDLGAVVAQMEATGQAAYFRGGMVFTPLTTNKNTLLNATDPFFTYTFYGDKSSKISLPTGMTTGDYLLRRNRNSDGSGINTGAYGAHPRVVFRDLTIYGGSSPNGSFFDCYRSSFSAERISFSTLLNGFYTDGYSDMKRMVSIYAENMTAGGWVFQQNYPGDGLVVENFMTYACAGMSIKKVNGGKISGLVSGWHEFIECDLSIDGVHLEGDGMADANTTPLISCQGSRLYIPSGVLYTTAFRPAIQISDNNGASRRHSSLTLGRELYFQQRLDDPGSAKGNRQGVAINILNPAKDTDLRLQSTKARIYKQNATVSDVGFDMIAPRITTGGVTTDEINLQAVLDARKPRLLGEVEIRYRNAAWEVDTPDLMGAMRTTRRSTSPVSLSTFATNPMTASWTTLTAGTYYYKAYTIDAESRQTAVTSEVSITVDSSNPVPQLSFNIYMAPVAIRILRGTTSGTYTSWVEVVAAREIMNLYDQGDAIAGQAWSSSGVPTPPTVNYTYDGYVLRGVNGKSVLFGTTPPTDGPWNVGDYMENTAPAVTGTAGSQYVIKGWSCVTAGTPGTWQQLRMLTGT